jgi:hypothetical protein
LLQAYKEQDLTITFEAMRWDMVTLSSLAISISVKMAIDLGGHRKAIDVVGDNNKDPNEGISTFIPSSLLSLAKVVEVNYLEMLILDPCTLS